MPFNFVVDGRVLRWQELSALEPFEGWDFRFVIEERVEQARTDGQGISSRGLIEARSEHRQQTMPMVDWRDQPE